MDKLNREGLAQLKNKIKPRVYIRHKRVVLCAKTIHFVNLDWHKENQFCSMWVQPYKIHFSDYPKSLISRIYEVYVFFNKISL